MKMPHSRYRSVAVLCVMLAISACGLKRVANDANNPPTVQADAAAAPDLPAAMSFMQPAAAFADLAELRHFSAYNTFHSTTSSGSSAGNAMQGAPVACFGNQ